MFKDYSNVLLSIIVVFIKADQINVASIGLHKAVGLIRVKLLIWKFILFIKLTKGYKMSTCGISNLIISFSDHNI